MENHNPIHDGRKNSTGIPMPKLSGHDGAHGASSHDEEAQGPSHPEVSPPIPPPADTRMNSLEITKASDPSTAQTGGDGCCMAFKRDVLEAWDLTDDMLFHWLGVGSFRELPLSLQRECWFVKWNPVYWFIWFGTIVSLFIGEKWHRLFGQVGKVSDDETRVEFEARVHWLYTTSGGMICNLAKAILTLIYDAALENSQPHFFKKIILPLIATCVMASSFALGNVCFVRMMRKKSRSGVRSIIVCNAVFSLGLFTSFVVSSIEGGHHSVNPIADWNAKGTSSTFWAVGKILASVCCIFFYVLATLLYSRLWNLYPAKASNSWGQIIEAAPSVFAAAIMVTLVVIGLKYKKYRTYIYSSFM
jgi:hypothetical protein